MPSQSYDVVAVGNAIVDIVVRVDDETLIKHDIVKGSMQLVDGDSARALYDAIGAGIEVSGGSAANTMAGLASLGGKAGFIGKIRDDQLGEVFAHDIRSIGVDFTTPAASEGESTARCLVLVTPDGERSMCTHLGISTELDAGDIDHDMIAAAQVTYLEGYLWDKPAAKDAFMSAAKSARAAGQFVALTLSDSFCVDRHRDSFRQLINKDVDILFANEAEILSLYEVDTFDEAMHKVRGDCRLVALTRSAAGSVIVERDDIHVVDAHPVDKVVDATGAGDLYAAGFLYGFTRGIPTPECARLGSLAAAEVISHLGARPQTPLAQLAREAGLIAAS